jgi:hypothetical protein
MQQSEERRRAELQTHKYEFEENGSPLPPSLPPSLPQMQQSEERRRAELLTRKYEFEELLAMDENNDGSVDIMEFTIYLLKLW